MEADAADIYAARIALLIDEVEALRRLAYLHGIGTRESRRHLGRAAKALQHIAEDDRESRESHAA